MTNITNAHGRQIDFDAASKLMDEEISQFLDGIEFSGEQAYFHAYCNEHRTKFGEEFEPNKANPVW
jgi:hypothetical protein